MKLTTNLIFALVILSLLIFPHHILASSVLENLNSAATGSYDTSIPPDENTIASITGLIIQILLGFLGLVFMILIIVAGIQWMTAGGNTESITKARQRMINAVIGLVIVIAAFSITTFVLSLITNVNLL
ncbi:MAG: pilin [Candidatus Komeilibacteria bacterium]|nr:pilin [Candidatus Komeilibacteria bacterium]